MKMMKKMEDSNIHHQNLNEILEKLVFDDGDLTNLKVSIDKVITGQISRRQFRETIIESRSRIFERLTEFIPFYLKQKKKNDTLNKFAEPDNQMINSELEEQLNERNRFIEEVGIKISNIYEKLRHKFKMNV